MHLFRKQTYRKVPGVRIPHSPLHNLLATIVTDDISLFEFNFPEHGTPCKNCEGQIPLEKYRTTGYCDDCEFDKLTAPGWLDKLQTAMKVWGNHKK